ncbi:hypothetical protein DL771_010483 [Monosporascus sp. 5C6A]|nr:hypothetical protein DL771_010483 [Monosporascus sp. 5C6A]
MEGLETTSGAAGTKGAGGTEDGDGGGLDELLGDDLGDEDMEDNAGLRPSTDAPKNALRYATVMMLPEV